MTKNKTSALYFAPLVGAFNVFFFVLFSFGGIAYAAGTEVGIVGINPSDYLCLDATDSGGGYRSLNVYTQASQPSIASQTNIVSPFGAVFGGFNNDGTAMCLTSINSSMASTIGDGDFYLIKSSNGGTATIEFWAEFSVAGGAIVPPGPPASEVVITTPVDSFIYPNNPIHFTGTYTNSATYDQLQIHIESNTIPQSLIPTVIPLGPISVVDAPFSFSRSLPFFGSYTIRGRLWDSALATGTPFSDDVSFVLGTTATTSTTTQSNLPGDPTPIDCSTFDIGCYLKNFIVWAFWPDEEIIASFSTLSLRSTFPFAYAYEAVDMVQILANPDSMASTSISATVDGFGTITFLSKDMLEDIPLSATVKTILGYLCWIGTVMYCYRVAVSAFDNRSHA